MFIKILIISIGQMDIIKLKTIGKNKQIFAKVTDTQINRYG